MDVYHLLDDFISHATPLTKTTHFIDLGMDAAGFIPYVGPVISISYPFYRDAMIDNVVIPAYEHLSE